jgi:hypoxanthine-guanine phosphoribosyltransferase
MLPFIAGAIVGAMAVIVVKNRKTIVEKISDTAVTAKDNIVDAGSTVKEKIHEFTSEEKQVTKVVKETDKVVNETAKAVKKTPKVEK